MEAHHKFYKRAKCIEIAHFKLQFKGLLVKVINRNERTCYKIQNESKMGF